MKTGVKTVIFLIVQVGVIQWALGHLPGCRDLVASMSSVVVRVDHIPLENATTKKATRINLDTHTASCSSDVAN